MEHHHRRVLIAGAAAALLSAAAEHSLYRQAVGGALLLCCAGGANAAVQAYGLVMLAVVACFVFYHRHKDPFGSKERAAAARILSQGDL